MASGWASSSFGASRRERMIAAGGAALLQGLLIYVLVIGLAVGVPTAVRDDLKLFGVTLPPPPPPVEKPHPEQAAKHRPDGAAAPPNLRAKPTEIVAPPLPPIVRPPKPVLAAPVAGTGSQSSAGAAPVAGPGTGAGGVGNGLGSGDGGDGDGDGDGTPARLRSGRFKDSDYPRAAWEVGFSGTVLTRFTVGTNGRVISCVVTKPSGNADVDATPCRVMMERFRYSPARDARGHPVPYEIEGRHDWTAPRPDPGDDR